MTEVGLGLESVTLMTTKVFLFDNDHCLYCSDVTLEDGVYHGRVINGAWNARIDPANNTVKSKRHSQEAKLIWACDPHQNLFHYNAVISDARVRYESGESADYDLKPEPVYEDNDDWIPF
jgi:hypothetical protein